MDCQVWIGTYS
jgi:hypothetical protein